MFVQILMYGTYLCFFLILKTSNAHFTCFRLLRSEQACTWDIGGTMLSRPWQPRHQLVDYTFRAPLGRCSCICMRLYILDLQHILVGNSPGLTLDDLVNHRHHPEGADPEPDSKNAIHQALMVESRKAWVLLLKLFCIWIQQIAVKNE